MRPQSDSSNTFNRRIVFTIISVVLVLLVVVGVLVVKDVTTGNQTHVALIANRYSDSKRDGYSYCYSKCSGFATAFWHQSGTVYR